MSETAKRILAEFERKPLDLCWERVSPFMAGTWVFAISGFKGKINYTRFLGYEMVSFEADGRLFGSTWWQKRKAKRLIRRVMSTKAYKDDQAMARRLEMRTVS